MAAGASSVRQTDYMAKAIDQEWLERGRKILAEEEVYPSQGVTLNVVADAPDLYTLMQPPNELMDPRWQGATSVASGLLAKGGIEVFAGRASRSMANAPAIQSFFSRLSKKAQLGGKTKVAVEATAKGASRVATGVAGAAAGTAVAVLLEKAFLEVDEAMHRKEFEEQLRKEIDRSETEFRTAAQCLS